MNDMIGLFLIACFVIAFGGGSYEAVMWFHRLTDDWVGTAAIYCGLCVVFALLFASWMDYRDARG